MKYKQQNQQRIDQNIKQINKSRNVKHCNKHKYQTKIKYDQQKRKRETKRDEQIQLQQIPRSKNQCFIYNYSLIIIKIYINSYKNYKMIKEIICVLAILTICSSITDKEIIQQMLNGIFEQNKLADPTTIVPCIDDTSAHQIVVFAGEVLDKAAKGTVSEIISLKKLIQDFGDSLDPAVGDCLNGNAEFNALGDALGVNNVDSATLEKKIIAYITLHYFAVHKWLVDLDDTFHAGDYYQVGYKGGVYAHNVLGLSLPQLTDKEIIQQMLNGIFEQNKLADPTTIVPCIDDTSAHQIVVFAGEVLDKAAKGTVSEIISLKKLIQDFGDSLDPAVGDCLNGNAEFNALGDALGVNNVDSATLEKKIIAYITLHYFAVHKWLVDLDDTFHAGDYYQVGYKGGVYAHNVLGLSLPQLTDKEIIQQMLNGIFEQNKLADPTTIVPCIDDTSAHQIVVFAGEVLDKAAKGTVSEIISLKKLIQDFGDSLDPAVGECLKGNAEFNALGDALGVNNVDSATLEKKIIAYITLHYFAVHKWLVDLDDTFHAGDYYQVGYKGGVYAHNVLGLSLPQLTDKEIIQQMLNGIFEQNKLADPTTIVPCIDDTSAHQIVVFAGEVLDKAAKGTVSEIISLKKLIQDFGDSLDPAVGDCLNGNAEFNALGDALGVNNVDSATLEKKIIAYITLHYFAVHKWLVDLDDTFHAGDYYQVGYKGGVYAHNVLGLSLPQLTDKEIIQQMLNGIFEQNKLADPTTIVPCIDDTSAHQIVVFAGEVLDKAAKGTVSEIISLKKLIQDFGDSLDPAVGECLKGNAEFNALGDALGVNNVDSATLEKKIIAYITLHYFAVHKWLVDLDDTFHAGDYYQVGYKGGVYAHNVLGSTLKSSNLRLNVE